MCVCVQWNLSLYEDTPELEDTSLNRTLFPPQVPLLHAFQPLKRGHLTNNDTSSAPLLSRLERFHCTLYTHEVKLAIILHQISLSLSLDQVKLKPEYAIAHSNLGHAHQELGEMADAELHFREALKLDSNHMLTKFRLAKLISDVGPKTTGRLREADTLWVVVGCLHTHTHTHTHAHTRTHAHTHTHTHRSSFSLLHTYIH